MGFWKKIFFLEAVTSPMFALLTPNFTQVHGVLFIPLTKSSSTAFVFKKLIFWKLFLLPIVFESETSLLSKKICITTLAK